jgi:CubicO group peptidase (beta-lactamase class C family)
VIISGYRVGEETVERPLHIKSEVLPLIIAALLLFGVLQIKTDSSTIAARAPSEPETWKTLSGETRTSNQADIFLVDLMKMSKTTALSVAVVQDGRVVFDRIMGVVDRKTGKPVDSGTVLRAASLSKPVFSYLVMKIVDEGSLGLD